MHEAVAAGDLVNWQNPRTPKRGRQLARVVDVAGPWALVEPVLGTMAGHRFWVLIRKLLVPPHDPTALARAVLKEVGVLPREEGDPAPLPEAGSAGWRDCLVCEGSLKSLGYQDDAKTFASIRKWLYCPGCDRMQRLP